MRKSLSLFSANLLFMITMLLVITVGSLIQSVSLSWGLIATECILIAFPSILFLRQQRVPLLDGLRLKPISVLTGVLCVALGISAYLFGLVIEGIMAQLTGLQSVSIPSTLLPKSSLDMIVYFFALAVFAPLGEEILFRGAVQGAYEEKKSASFAIVITALMFAFYHFRLSGLPALIPVAFILGYVVWKTRSVIAGMLIHFGNNGASAAQNIYYFTTGKALPFLSLWSALIGLVLAIVILLVIQRMHSTTAPVAQEPSVKPVISAGEKKWLATYWPLIISGILYLSVAGLTLVQTFQARFAPSTQVSYGLPILHAPVQSHYAITNEGGQSVGEMDCTLFPAAGSRLRLDCSRTVHAFEITVGNSFYKDGNHDDSISITWDATTMELLSFSYENKYHDGSVTASSVENGRLVSTDATGAHELALPENALIEFEWAWHAALLKANSGQSFSIPFGYLMRWDEKTNTSTPMLENEVLRVYDDEILSLPMGETTARKLTLAGGTAWFAKDDAIAGLVRPVKFDDGMLIYSLEK
jgi:uncharacterized protein